MNARILAPSMNGVIPPFDARGFSIPGERAGWCLDCGCFFSLPRERCPRCHAETFVAALKFMNAMVTATAKATPIRREKKRRRA